MKLFGLLFIILELYIPPTQGCRLWMCEAPEHHALLFHSDGTGIYYPDKVKERGSMCSSDHFKAIDIPEGETVIAACPGENDKNSEEDLSENKFKNFETSSLTLTCRNDRLVNNDMDIDWSDLGCSRKLFPTIRISGKSCGDQQGHIITIGWKIDNNMFIPQIDTCFDKETETSLYEHHFIHGRYMDASEKNGDPDFKHGGVSFSTNIEDLYKNNEYSYTNRPHPLFGIDKHVSNYLARGHLAPNADFVTEEEQDATYYFINVVPQWQRFNNANWKTLERATRKLAEDMEHTLRIWTGTHGILQLPDDQGNTVPVYLGQLVNLNIIPVPELMWKVVYNLQENRQVVFIGLNDIRESNDNDLNSLCQDICSEITWVKFDNDKKKGKMICCSLQDAKRVIPTLPESDDISLLRDEL